TCDANFPIGPDPVHEDEAELVTVVLRDSSRRKDQPAAAVDVDGAGGHPISTPLPDRRDWDRGPAPARRRVLSPGSPRRRPRKTRGTHLGALLPRRPRSDSWPLCSSLPSCAASLETAHDQTG